MAIEGRGSAQEVICVPGRLHLVNGEVLGLLLMKQPADEWPEPS